MWSSQEASWSRCTRDRRSEEQRWPSRFTISRSWTANQEHSTIRRCTATGSFLPASLRCADLEQNHGAQAGARRYIKVLQLLGEHPLERVRQAVEDCRRARVISAEAIIQRTRTLAASDAQARPAPLSAVESIVVSQVHVPLPDLSLFNQLLGSPTCRDDVHQEAFSSDADDASSERHNAQFFA